MCSSLLLAGMICHFYREGFCSNRSVMLRRLMPDETALRELSESVIEKLKLLIDAEFAELEFPPD